MIQGLTVDAVVNLPENSPVWIAINEDTGGRIGIGDKGSDKPAILAFLKREDAEHYTQLLRDNGPSDRMVAIEEVPVHDFLLSQKERGEMYVAVIPPNSAMKFFKEFPDSFYEYYE